jgi:hypothetical protein
VLELLAAAGQRGITEAALSALGCRVETLSNVVRTGLASVTVESMLASDKTIEIVRVTITEAGRLEVPSCGVRPGDFDKVLGPNGLCDVQERPAVYWPRDRLRGWGGRIRTLMCRKKIHLFDMSREFGFGRLGSDARGPRGE